MRELTEALQIVTASKILVLEDQLAKIDGGDPASALGTAMGLRVRQAQLGVELAQSLVKEATS